jgi:hypothetical protein
MLSDALYRHIVTFIPTPEVCRAQRTCRQFRRAFDADYLQKRVNQDTKVNNALFAHHHGRTVAYLVQREDLSICQRCGSWASLTPQESIHANAIRHSNRCHSCHLYRFIIYKAHFPSLFYGLRLCPECAHHLPVTAFRSSDGPFYPVSRQLQYSNIELVAVQDGTPAQPALSIQHLHPRIKLQLPHRYHDIPEFLLHRFPVEGLPVSDQAVVLQVKVYKSFWRKCRESTLPQAAGAVWICCATIGIILIVMFSVQTRMDTN